jgi:hypothetical protein
MESVTWLHLSDWHQKIPRSRHDSRQRLRTTVEILRDLKRLLSRRHIERIDLIVFNGDVAFSGDSDEYAEAEAVFFGPLERFTRVPRDRWVVVAGNHDLHRPALGNLPPDLLRPVSPETYDTTATDAATTDPAKRDELRKPFENFRAWASAFRADADWAYAARPLPPAGGVALEVYALNTALYGDRPDAAGGRRDYGALFVGKDQIDTLPRTPSPRLDLPTRTLRLAVIHHPPSWLFEAERSRLQETLFDTVHFVLVGHEHNQRAEEVVSCYGDVVVLPAGPSFDDQALADGPDARYGMAYNVTQLRFQPGEAGAASRLKEGRVWMRRWNASARKFVADPRYPTVPGGVYPLRSLGTPPPAFFWSVPPGAPPPP